MIENVSRDLIVSELLASIIPKIIEAIGSNLKSVFLVGSMAKPNYIMRNNNDFDLRFIVSEFNAFDYQQISGAMDILVSELNSSELNVSTSNIIGPVRYSEESKISLFIHYIILTEEALDSLPKLHKFSYSQSYLLIWGDDFVSHLKNTKYSTDDICYNTEGIFYCVDMLNKRRLKYQKWVPINDKMCLQSFEDEMCDTTFIETLRYSLIKALYNCRMWFKWHDIDLEENDINELFKYLNLEVQENLFDSLLHLIKRDYSNCDISKNVCDSMINLLIKIADSILNFEKTKIKIKETAL